MDFVPISFTSGKIQLAQQARKYHSEFSLKAVPLVLFSGYLPLEVNQGFIQGSINMYYLYYLPSRLVLSNDLGTG